MGDSTPIADSDLRPGESPGGTTIIVDVPTSEIPSAPLQEAAIHLRASSRYGATPSTFAAPPLDWLQGTWSVTHSTLSMWRKAKNVCITYTVIPASNPSDPPLLDDVVASEPTERTLLPQPKTIRGIDTPSGEGAWNWRGAGWLKFATSRWEILGWGERGGEKWAVTWFAPSLFTPQGVDIYSSKKEGIDEELCNDILQALERLPAKELVDLVKTEMRKVKIEY